MQWIEQFKRDLKATGVYHDSVEVFWSGYAVVIFGEHVDHCEAAEKYLDIWLRENLPGKYTVKAVPACCLRISETERPE